MKRHEIVEQVINLHKEIVAHNKLYYHDSSPSISDAEYDLIKHRFLSLLSEYKDIIPKYLLNLPIVGHKPSKSFTKIAHSHPMLSLDNAFSSDEMISFCERIYKTLDTRSINFSCQEKIDGVSFSLIYNHGTISHAVTRGDGSFGEDITANVLTIDSIPISIDRHDIVEVRGEIYIEKEDFLDLNKQLQDQGLKTFANPRNAASGSLRQIDSSVTKSRKLRYKIWDGLISDYDKHSEILNAASSMGFHTVDNSIVHSVEAIIDHHKKLSGRRSNIPYDIDGAVYKVDELSLQNILSNKSHSPRWAIAFKFPPESSTTELLDIFTQVSRHGLITPVAKLSPINIGGTVISKATLHNFNEIERNDFRIGDIVNVKRAGDVIPSVTSVYKRGEQNIKYSRPITCPSCDSPISQLEDSAFYHCTNKASCPAQKIQTLTHFCSKKCFNIAGLAEKQITQLYNENIILSATDIVSLPQNEQSIAKIMNLKGWGQKSVEELIRSISSAKTSITLPRFLFSLNIKHLGQVSSKIISKHLGSVANIIHHHRENSLQERLKSIPGIGDMICLSFSKHIEENFELFCSLSEYLAIPEFNAETTGSSLHGKTLVFTGTLQSTTRSAAKTLAESLGATVTNSISQNTDYLIVGASPGSKKRAAETLGITILNEKEWIKLSSV